VASSRLSQDVRVWQWVKETIKDNVQEEIGVLAVDCIGDMSVDATDLFELLAEICDPTDIFEEDVLKEWVGGE
jgi:hypothetical protein